MDGKLLKLGVPADLVNKSPQPDGSDGGGLITSEIISVLAGIKFEEEGKNK